MQNTEKSGKKCKIKGQFSVICAIGQMCRRRETLDWQNHEGKKCTNKTTGNIGDNGFCIEFKYPTNNYQVSQAQKEMKRKYKMNNYKFVLSNDYDKIFFELNTYMANIRIKCKFWKKILELKYNKITSYRIS